MCIFVVLCVDETYYMRECSDAIKLTKSYPPPPPPPPPARESSQ